MSEAGGLESGGIRADELRVEGEIAVQRFVLNDLLTNGFVVREEDTGALAVVDPGDRAGDLIAAARDWGGDVRWILITHLHGDHCAAVAPIREAFGAPVAGPPGGMFRVERPVCGGETLDFGSKEIQVAATPGHSPESVSFQICDHVFVGDFLFRLGSGRTDGARASTEALFGAVRDVFGDLPGKTTLWCGHGPASTVREEKAGNPFWRIALAGDPATPVDQVSYRGAHVPVLAWADDYDGGKKALLALADGSKVIVPGSQVGPPVVTG
ncbi:MAG TPA: MBL fold metallo-hydrolase [Gemmatimonadota bacterium]|nr:MBL fold metallo-hydrolase [Gemmatimonadota bacterium]